MCRCHSGVCGGVCGSVCGGVSGDVCGGSVSGGMCGAAADAVCVVQYSATTDAVRSVRGVCAWDVCVCVCGSVCGVWWRV